MQRIKCLALLCAGVLRCANLETIVYHLHQTVVYVSSLLTHFLTSQALSLLLSCFLHLHMHLKGLWMNPPNPLSVPGLPSSPLVSFSWRPRSGEEPKSLDTELQALSKKMSWKGSPEDGSQIYSNVLKKMSRSKVAFNKLVGLISYKSILLRKKDFKTLNVSL